MVCPLCSFSAILTRTLMSRAFVKGGTDGVSVGVVVRMGAEGTLEVVQDVKLSHFFDMRR